MLRVLSLFGLAALVVAAVAVANPRALFEEPKLANDDHGDDRTNQGPVLTRVAVLPFHAPFSLN